MVDYYIGDLKMIELKRYVLLDAFFDISVPYHTVLKKMKENNIKEKENKLWLRTFKSSKQLKSRMEMDKIYTVSECGISFRCQILSNEENIEQNKNKLIEYMKKQLESRIQRQLEILEETTRVINKAKDLLESIENGETKYDI